MSIVTTTPSDTELHAREFDNSSSEIEMLIGFFLMNGACISNNLKSLTLNVEYLKQQNYF